MHAYVLLLATAALVSAVCAGGNLARDPRGRASRRRRGQAPPSASRKSCKTTGPWKSQPGADARTQARAAS